MKLFKHPFMKIIALFLGICLFAFAGQAMGEDDEEDGGTIVFTKPVKAVIFEHSIHMDAGLDCDSCHDDPFEMAAGTAEENDDFTMQALYDGQYCGACHDGDTAFASNTRCTACHIGVRGYQRMNGESPDTEGHGGGHE